MRRTHRLILACACAAIGGTILAMSCGAQSFNAAPATGASGLGPPPAAPTLPSTLSGAAMAPAPASSRLGTPDLAFGAFQRGYYVTALQEATKRVDANPNDGPAMTLIAELYAQGLGVRRDPVEAGRWLKLGAEHGDRQATFALALAELKGDGVPKDRPQRRSFFRRPQRKTILGRSIISA